MPLGIGFLALAVLLLLGAAVEPNRGEACTQGAVRQAETRQREPGKGQCVQQILFHVALALAVALQTEVTSSDRAVSELDPRHHVDRQTVPR